MHELDGGMHESSLPSSRTQASSTPSSVAKYVPGTGSAGTDQLVTVGLCIKLDKLQDVFFATKEELYNIKL